MASRTLELTLISAKDLKDVNLFSKMEVFAVVSVDVDPRYTQRTAVDRTGGSSPAWNQTLRFSIPAGRDPRRHVVRVLLRSERALGDRDIGEVQIPLSELVDGKGPQFVSYQVRKPNSSKAKGVLNLSYKFADSTAAYPPSAPSAAYSPASAYPPPSAYPAGSGAPYPPPAKAGEPVTAYPAVAGAAYPPPAKAAKASKADEPVTAYPAVGSSSGAYPPSYPNPAGYPSYPPSHGYSGQPPQAGYGYPPQPPSGYGYPPPPQAGYGYGAPPPQAGYGYGAPQPQKKKNKLGMGLGAGLLGGALGGLLIGDMIGDSGGFDGGYDGGYDGGFDDGGGFDF